MYEECKKNALVEILLKITGNGISVKMENVKTKTVKSIK